MKYKIPEIFTRFMFAGQSCGDGKFASSQANHIFKKWVESNCFRLYSESDDKHDWVMSGDPLRLEYEYITLALPPQELKPIECEHSAIHIVNYAAKDKFECRHCGKRLKPTGWTTVDEGDGE